MFRRVGVCLLLAIAMLAAMSTSALAAEWYVDASIGSDANPGDSPAAPFRSVTRASQAAAPGDRVHVADGLYASHTTGEVFPIQMIEGVLQGAGAASVTILGTDTSPVIEGTGITSSARIDGFTITGGSPGLDFVGSALTISNNTVRGNAGGYAGGGIRSAGGSSRIIDNLIAGNVGTYGGGVLCENADFSHIEGNVIEQNIATQGGGGVECYYNSNPTIVRNVIRDNSAALGGGIMSESGCLPHVSETVIQGNSANPTGGGKGGAIVCFSGSVILENCLVADNHSSDYAISGINSSATRIVNCTIALNGPGVIGRYSTDWGFAVEVRNSILWDTGPAVEDGTAAAITYSDVEGGYAGEGNIDADPLFVDPTSDFHLAAGSPCIDAGADEPAIVTDLEGTPRPSGAGWDMGAYEFASEAGPSADAGGPYTGSEGASISFDGSLSRAEGPPITVWAWDLDDDGEFDDGSGELVTFAYDDDYHGAIRLRVTDANGMSAEASSWVDVDNAAPVLSDPVVPSATVPVGEAATMQVSLTDAGIADAHVATVRWGDGTATEGLISGAGGVYVVEGVHTYTSAGIYTISVSVTDDDGATDVIESTESIVVYDASLGLLAARGWMDSPEGSYILDPSLSGKLSFTISSDYEAGASAPVGRCELEVKKGDFHFSSDAQQWLVVEQDDRVAQLRCTGLLNGVHAPTGAPFDCLIWAGDGILGGADGLRIKIWYEDPAGTEIVVYGTFANQPIGGGFVKVQPS